MLRIGSLVVLGQRILIENNPATAHAASGWTLCFPESFKEEHMSNDFYLGSRQHALFDHQYSLVNEIGPPHKR